MRADLHIHTYYSDGQQSPEMVVFTANARGVDLIAITDHDNMNGCEQAITASKDSGVTVIRGMEISAYDGDCKIHTLGYNLHPCDKLTAYLKKLYDGSIERTLDIISKLKKCGINLTLNDVLRECKNDTSPIHSTYISRAASRKGYGTSPNDFFYNYLMYGKPGYSIVARPTAEDAIEIIRESGGISSLAHPGRISLEPDEKLKLIERLCDCGLNGIEAVYSGHTEEETAYYKEIAKKHNLLVTGGSDTHFPEGKKQIGDPLYYPSDELLTALGIVEK